MRSRSIAAIVVALPLVTRCAEPRAPESEDQPPGEISRLGSPDTPPNANVAEPNEHISLELAAACEGESTGGELLDSPSSSHLSDLYKSGAFRMGVCVFEAVVGMDGHVVLKKVIRPSPPDSRLERALRSQLATWRFSPTELCGKPVQVILTGTINHCPVPVRDGGADAEQGVEPEEAR